MDIGQVGHLAVGLAFVMAALTAVSQVGELADEMA